jgi:predicted TIM-barrel fold metal-dependent hydrolase
MKAAAEGKNVFCKVSALMEGAQREQNIVPIDVSTYRPVLDALWEIFGEDRLLYGSNWPVSNNAAPYAAIHGLVASYVNGRGKAAAEKFFKRNALAAYKPVDRSRQ